MALKRITPGLKDTTLVTLKHKFYTDIDLSFVAKAGTVQEDGTRRGDLYKKTDVAAIEQSITTILLTNRYEKPFNPDFGSNLRSMLFDPISSGSESMIRELIISTIKEFEPRVEVLEVVFFDAGAEKPVPKGASSLTYWGMPRSSDRFTLVIILSVRILNTNEVISIDVNMNRLR